MTQAHQGGGDMTNDLTASSDASRPDEPRNAGADAQLVAADLAQRLGEVVRERDDLRARIDTTLGTHLYRGVEFDLRAAERLVSVFGGDDAQITVCQWDDGHAGPGLYAYFTDYPEEGALPLFDTPPDAAAAVDTTAPLSTDEAQAK